MIKALLLSLLLQASIAPEDRGRSSFVDLDHQHEWLKLDDIEGGGVWADANSVNSVSDGADVYPLLLIRIAFEEGASPWAKLDSLHAVDCERSQIATFNGSVPVFPNHVEKIPDFHPWPKPDSPAVHQLMRAACGEDWQPLAADK